MAASAASYMSAPGSGAGSGPAPPPLSRNSSRPSYGRQDTAEERRGGQAGCAAAEEDRFDAVTGQQRRPQPDVAHQCVHIRRDEVVETGIGVEVAVGALVVAKGQVQ